MRALRPHGAFDALSVQPRALLNLIAGPFLCVHLWCKNMSEQPLA